MDCHRYSIRPTKGHAKSRVEWKVSQWSVPVDHIQHPCTNPLLGSTSLSFLLSTTIPASAAEQYDLREHNKWEISDDGNGIIRVTAPPTQESGGYFDPKRGHSSLNKPVLNAQTISLLVNAYFDHLAPLFPIISRTEFASKPNPSPLLLCSICGLGATRRTFPREVFAGVRGVINGLLRSNDILSDARFEHVQALVSGTFVACT